MFAISHTEPLFLSSYLVQKLSEVKCSSTFLHLHVSESLQKMSYGGRVTNRYIKHKHDAFVLGKADLNYNSEKLIKAHLIIASEENPLKSLKFKQI